MLNTERPPQKNGSLIAHSRARPGPSDSLSCTFTVQPPCGPSRARAMRRASWAGRGLFFSFFHLSSSSCSETVTGGGSGRRRHGSRLTGSEKCQGICGKEYKRVIRCETVDVSPPRRLVRPRPRSKSIWGWPRSLKSPNPAMRSRGSDSA